ncbi:unnamed protein product [Durusdinium trenchii]|uniref:Uncharacterized protein n=1 Tax=Durusdinium trenchii TaxID=1381693 RepID=A0ABP0SWB7_9DINO
MTLAVPAVPLPSAEALAVSGIMLATACLRMIHLTVYFSELQRELLKQEMEIDRRHDEQLLALQQAAYNLTNTDTGLLGDVSDPYVVVRLGGQEFTTPAFGSAFVCVIVCRGLHIGSRLLK